MVVGFFCLASGSDLQYFLAVPHLWYSILRNITRPFFGVCLIRILFALGLFTHSGLLFKVGIQRDTEIIAHEIPIFNGIASLK